MRFLVTSHCVGDDVEVATSGGDGTKLDVTDCCHTVS